MQPGYNVIADDAVRGTMRPMLKSLFRLGFHIIAAGEAAMIMMIEDISLRRWHRSARVNYAAARAGRGR